MSYSLTFCYRGLLAAALLRLSATILCCVLTTQRCFICGLLVATLLGSTAWFLFAVHCDITVWYMTSVMSPNRSIYLFTPERPRDLSMRAPEPAPSGVLILDYASDLFLF